MRYAMARQHVYHSIQGEGALLGEPTVFIRLAGCSVGCRQCDTDYRFTRHCSAGSIARDAARVRRSARWAWVTGGEPTDQEWGPLAEALKAEGFKVALATSGVRELPAGLADWISVSPHRPGRMPQWYGHEVKLVAGLNGLELFACDPRDYLSFPYRYAGGSHGQHRHMAEAVRWVDEHPGWRLAIQAHRQPAWRIP